MTARNKAAQTGDKSTGLMFVIQEHTRTLHVEAEKTGIIRELLRGQANRSDYMLFLRNLLPVYQRLEEGLERHRETPVIGLIAKPALYRSAAISSDLCGLCGDEWQNAIPLLASAERYAEKIADAAKNEGSGLIAHAYVRYMGDLNGGQILKRLLCRSLNLTPATLAFYDFPAIADVETFKTDYRNLLERAGQQTADVEAVVEESAEAFRLNIALSKEVAAWGHSRENSPPS